MGTSGISFLVEILKIEIWIPGLSSGVILQ